jgi:hypothetical protein
MAYGENTTTRMLRGWLVALLTLVVSAIALKTRTSPLLIGLGSGIVSAFIAANTHLVVGRAEPNLGRRAGESLGMYRLPEILLVLV